MTPAERLRKARKQRGLTVPALADLVGLSQSAIKAHENGQNRIQAEVAEIYARALKVAPEYLLYGVRREDSVGDVRMIPVMGEVQAGVWKEIPLEEEEPTEFLPFADPMYQRATQVFVLNVRGESMNKFYADGSQIVVVSAMEAGVREGDHVVVRRKHNSFVETTLKEVVLSNGKIELWPRSNDPRYQEPFVLERVRDADEGPEIIAIVIGAYHRRPPRTGLPVL